MDGNGVPPWLDKHFVETVLRRDAGDASLSVVDLDVQLGVPKGENTWSLLLRVNVTFVSSRSGLEMNTSLIVKSRPGGDILDKWIDAVGHFRREAHIYALTLPHLYRLLDVADNEHFTPKVYACHRPDTIIMEDLKPLGYKMADRRVGLDLKQSKMALKVLARLHGLSIVLKARHPASMSEYTESLYTETTREMHKEFLVPFYATLAREVATWPGFQRFEHKIKQVSSVEFDRVLELVENKPGSVAVLNHGDFWTNNILFRYDGDDIVDVKLIDFQVVRFASPALDLIYFLNTSLSQQVLEDHADDLLECYHVALCDVMTRVHSPPELIVSKEQLRKEMTDKSFFGVVVSFKLCLMVAEPSESPEFSTLKEGAVETGVEAMGKIFAGSRFREAFQRRLLKFESQGLI